MEAASAVSQSVRSMMLSLGDHVARRKESRKPKEEAFVGYFCGMPAKEQEALVELARITVKEMCDIDRADHRALDEYHKVQLYQTVVSHCTELSRCVHVLRRGGRRMRRRSSTPCSHSMRMRSVSLSGGASEVWRRTLRSRWRSMDSGSGSRYGCDRP